MDDDRVSALSGMAGRVLREAIGPATLLTGFCLGVAVFVCGFVASRPHGGGLGQFLGQAVLALALARFALNGYAGEWSGTLFSTRGGSWAEAAAVAGRYLLLSLVWLLPLLAAGSDPAAILGILQGHASGKTLGLLLFGVFVSMLTPPASLIAAVSARNAGDLFRAEHWKRLFAGRIGDLFVINALYLGALGMTVFLSLPVVFLAALMGPKLAVTQAVVSVVFAGGLAVALLGRLCGFFAAGEAEEAAAEPAAPSPAGWSSAPGPSYAAPPVMSSPGLAAPAPARLASAGVAAAAAVPAAPAVSARGPVPAAASGAAPVLLEARERVDAAWRRFETDRPGAIATLEELKRDYAPHPFVLQALALAHFHVGDETRAIAAAREAFPLCLQRGHLHVAAELFRTLLPRASQLGLNRDQVLAVAAGLREMGDWKSAANAYATLINLDAGEPRAVKGMLQCGDFLLNQQNAVQEAWRIYRFLLEKCAASPLVEYMRKGLAESERRLARV